MKLSATLLSLALVAPAVAHADTAFTTQASYNAAAGSQTTITFNGLSGGSFVQQPQTFTLSGATFANTTGSSIYIVSPSGFYGSSYAGGDFLTIDYAVDTLTISFPSAKSFAFNFGGIFGGATIPVLLSDGFTYTASGADSITGTNALDFIGFTSTTAITSATLFLPDSPNYNALDNISFGATTTATTPEPGSFALLATGMLGVAGAARRKLAQRRQSAR